MNPRQTRPFAPATGRLATSDRVDAKGPARIGRALALAPTPPGDPDLAQLSGLAARRGVLVAQIRAEANRAGTTPDSWLSKEIALMLKVSKPHLAVVKAKISTLI